MTNSVTSHWYEAFLHQHANLAKRLTENVSFTRTIVSEASLINWFCKVEDYLKTKNLININPSRIFNTNKTALFLNTHSGPILTKKNCENVYNIVNNNEKEFLTTLITDNAASQLALPLIMF